ncbi:uncharacterized protein LOC128193676 [Vigna angularis]|uniref:uncharacterized protein LOC128193676 n=1 Tax=Phaseolus angularis TaxID=3914 RepID=UPI0022B49281|nr:uncharacterized protein LOC128193676 [Vigna angularis]
MGVWDEILPLVEFTYNNNFQSSIGMASFETLYGRKCRTPLCWFQEGENVLTEPELIQQTTEKVKLIQERLKTSLSRQKSYADRRRRPLEFAAGDHSSTFSQLRKYIANPSHILELEDVQLRHDRTLELQPVRVEDSRTKLYKGKDVCLVKVVWDAKTGESTWEVEDAMRDLYPHLFMELPTSLYYKSHASSPINLQHRRNARPTASYQLDRTISKAETGKSPSEARP